VRSCITAQDESEFMVADFSNIEGRVAADLAGEEWKLDAFRAFDAGTGPDLYNLAYAKSFNIPLSEVDDSKRQIGKVQELALQYQGWVGAFESMAKNYGVRLPEEVVIEVCAGWRNAHPAICGFWRALESTAIAAVDSGSVYHVGPLMLGMRDGFLRMRLPSGRMLAYYQPIIIDAERHGKPVRQLTYMAINSYTKQWERTQSYGGCLFENAVQAIARDCLAEAMKRVAEREYHIVLHVHDEIVVEAIYHPGGMAEFTALMSRVPAWAPGLPIAVKTWHGKRYRKD
jgi:DNA polymerase